MRCTWKKCPNRAKFRVQFRKSSEYVCRWHKRVIWFLIQELIRKESL